MDFNRMEDIEKIENMWNRSLKMETENMIRERERDIQKQMIDSTIRESRYNKRYKEVGIGIESPNYLRREILDIDGMGDKIRTYNN